MKAAITLQYSQADGFPCDLTFCSHFLQIAEVFPLLKFENEKKLLDFLIMDYFFFVGIRAAND